MNKKIIILISILVLAVLAGGFWYVKNNLRKEIMVGLEKNKNLNSEHEIVDFGIIDNCSEDEKKVFDNYKLDCKICPKEGDVFPGWCDLDKLKKQPDCLFNFCGEGGIDLGNNYKKYKNRIYYWYNGPQAVPGMSLVNANFDTFQSFGGNSYNYGKDDRKVFMRNWEIKEANPAAFELMRYNNGDTSLYSKDDKSVFYDGEKIEGADSATLKIYDNDHRIAKDKGSCYRSGHVVNSDLCDIVE